MVKSTPSIPRELPLRVNLPSFLLREIGRIVSRHAILEWKLSRTVYTLLAIDPVCGRVTIREPRRIGWGDSRLPPGPGGPGGIKYMVTQKYLSYKKPLVLYYYRLETLFPMKF
jgi:hypothetical protein